MKEESKIGPLEKDENGRPFRIINGEKIYQIEDDEKTNAAINAFRASGMSLSEYLKYKSGRY